ncbi:MAG: hypothetical protein ACR2HQ_08330 [Ilumatobacteraceae bacterium]
MSDDMEPRTKPDEGVDLTAPGVATDPGSVSEVAAATSSNAADTVIDSSLQAYTDKSDRTAPTRTWRTRRAQAAARTPTPLTADG